MNISTSYLSYLNDLLIYQIMYSSKVRWDKKRFYIQIQGGHFVITRLDHVFTTLPLKCTTYLGKSS